jgi:hypothetical protein
LQIIKSFEKEKDFLIPIWQWAETLLEAKPGPASHSLSPPIFPFLRGPTPTQLHRSRRGPVELIQATPEVTDELITEWNSPPSRFLSN